MPFYDRANIMGVIKRLKLTPDAKKSQNFVIKRDICRKMVDLAIPTENISPIIEIGPGLGAFTDFILKAADKVIIIEKDSRFFEFLSNYYQERTSVCIMKSNKIDWYQLNKLTLIQSDILEMDFPPGVIYISNLPFQISYNFVKYLAQHNDFSLATLILQQDFVDHLISTPNHSHYSAISVIFQSFFSCEIKMELNKTDFYPIPEVNTTIVQIIPKKSIKIDAKDIIPYLIWIESIFKFKNKTLRNAFKQLKWNSDALVDNILDKSAASLTAEQLYLIYTTCI